MPVAIDRSQHLGSRQAAGAPPSSTYAGRAAAAADPVESPPPAHGHLRPRLLPELDRRGVRLTALVAPAGTGKTTLLAQWAARAVDGGTPVAWLRLPAGSGPEDTGAAVLRAVARALPGHVLAGRDLSALRVPVTLVVDDVEGSPAAMPVVEDLLRSCPSLHVVVAGRALPPVNLARREIAARLVPADLLRFREHEVAALFAEHHQLPLRPPDVTALTRHTAGWAAALELFHSAVAGLPAAERAAAVRRLGGGRVRYARAYLAREVLAGLPDRLVTLLRETAPLESVTAGRCEALLGRDVNRELLELERLASLVDSPDEGASLAVHPVLRAHLLTEARELAGDRAVDARLGAAAVLLEADGDPAGAARALVSSGDWESLRRLVTRHGPALLDDAHARTGAAGGAAWVDDVPEAELDASPWLRVGRGERRLREGALAAAASDAARARAAFAAASDDDALARADRLELAATSWLGEPIAWSGAWQVRLRAALVRPVQVLQREQSTRLPRTAGDVVVVAVARMLCGDLVGARRCVQNAVAVPGDEPGTLLVELLRLVLGHGAAPVGRTDRGDRDGPAVDPGELADRAETSGLPWLGGLVRLVELVPAYASGAPPDDPLARRAAEADRAGDRWTAMLACGLRAVLLMRADAADVAAFEELVERLRPLHCPALEAWARAGLALASAAAGLPEASCDAEQAAAFAVACQVTGAQSVAHAALASARPEQAPDLLALARAEAGAAGFDVRPWVWIAERRMTAVDPRDRPAPVSVRCFGRFEISVLGVEPRLRQVRPRAREVLRLLAAHAGRPVHREELLETLWPDLDPVAATHNLHVAVSSLRTMLEPGVPRGASQLLVRQDDRYQLVLPPGSTCDLRSVDEAMAEAGQARAASERPRRLRALARAVSLYRGDVLPEDGPAEWVVPIRERYRLRVAEAAGQLAELHLELGDPRSAADAAQRSLDIDAWRDASWRILLAAYTVAGDVAAAQRTRSAYADMLASLGVQPPGR